MKTIFGKLKMNWLAVILFAIATGVYTGAVMCIPSLKETSFQDIGISYECWVVFAVIVVTNCRKPLEAMIKCFVFFLISQPLVYATEIVFGHLSFEMGWYYYRTIWFKATLLTLPGGLIAYFCKKQNTIGAIILGLGNTIELLLGVYYARQAVIDFPHHLISAIFCVAAMVFMSCGIQRSKSNRLVSLILPVGLTAGICLCYHYTTGLWL